MKKIVLIHSANQMQQMETVIHVQVSDDVKSLDTALFEKYLGCLPYFYGSTPCVIFCCLVFWNTNFENIVRVNI